jgi:hypothetical protein
MSMLLLLLLVDGGGGRLPYTVTYAAMYPAGDEPLHTGSVDESVRIPAFASGLSGQAPNGHHPQHTTGAPLA